MLCYQLARGVNLSTISQLFYQFAEKMPAKPALWCEGVVLSYAEMATLVGRWARGMAERGVERGDRIAVLLPNNPEFVAMLLVAADLGAVLVPLNTSLPPIAVLRAFETAGVKHVFGNATTLMPLAESTLPFFSVATGLWLSLDLVAPGVEVLPEWVASASVDVQPLFVGEDDDPFILTMTSGSTGDPKPIVLTQRTKINRVKAAQELYAISDADRTLAATPLYHSLAERLVLIPLLTGGTSVLMSRFSASEWVRIVGEQQVSFTIAVSSQLRQILELINTKGATSMSSLRCIVSSSALLDPCVKSDLLARLTCDFHECYGASEIAIASNLDSKDARVKLSSVGRAAPGVEIRILTENGEVASAGQIGEIVCKTPMMFGGYFERPDLTYAAMWGEYFKTGDVGWLDEDGFLYFAGRKKEIIITGGINVYPSDIEAVVSSYATVAESAAFPIEDESLGEVVGVAVVPEAGTGFDPKMLRRHCAQHLADFQQPRKFFILNQLPKNAMGKLTKQVLIDQYGRG